MTIKPTRRTPKKNTAGAQAAFLAALRENGNVSEACQRAAIARSAVYDWKAADPTFAAAWDAALDEAIDSLEAAAWKRARKQSDTLLIFLLKAHRPALYRETVRNEHSGPDGGPIVYDYYRARLQQRLRAEPAGTDQSRLPDRAE